MTTSRLDATVLLRVKIMLDKKLTIENGIAEVGPPTDAFQLVIGKDHPITTTLKRLRRAVEELSSNPKVSHIYNHGGGIALFEGGRQIMLAEDQNPGFWAFALTEATEAALHEPISRINHDLNFRSFFDIRDCTSEALLNAIEHGTNFCEKGEVSVQYIRGKTHALITITQSTAITKRKRLDDFIQNPGHYETPNGFKRGAGMYLQSVVKDVRVNYCDIEPNGFAVCLLAPRAEEPS